MVVMSTTVRTIFHLSPHEDCINVSQVVQQLEGKVFSHYPSAFFFEIVTIISYQLQVYLPLSVLSSITFDWQITHIDAPQAYCKLTNSQQKGLSPVSKLRLMPVSTSSTAPRVMPRVRVREL
jgi:hypothetical protein